jgi:DNA-binding NarL/FixJ family response regulator
MKQALVVDDHPLVRDGLRDLLQTHFPSIEVKTSAGGDGVLEEVCGTPWAFVVLDINLPTKNWLGIIKQARASHPELPIIVFSVHAERQYGGRALRAGAIAYLSKDRSPRDLVEVVRKILEGSKIRRSIPKLPVLSRRELQVLALLGKGMRRNQISTQLAISEKTVSTYQARLLEKLEMRNLVELIRYAVDEGLVQG